MFLGKLDLSDEVIVGTPNDTIIQTNDGRSSLESRDSAHVCWSTVEDMEQHTGALLVKAMDKSMCQGVGNGLRTRWARSCALRVAHFIE